MAIKLSQTNGAILSEYAATSTVIYRNLTPISGVLTPTFSASIAYQRFDFIVDASGNRVGTVSTPPSPGTAYDPTFSGNINLDSTKVAPLLGAMGSTTEAIGDQIEAIVDGLIQADLIVRGILKSA